LKEMNMTVNQATAVCPWYREPWVWFLIAIPFVSVIGGAITLSLAISSDDGLVADDYYKRGLEINRDIKREQTAERLGLTVRLDFSSSNAQVIATLPPGTVRPDMLTLQFAHPTRNGLDQTVRLLPISQHAYAAAVHLAPASHWRVSIEDPQATWRIAGVWQANAREIVLSARSGSYIPVN